MKVTYNSSGMKRAVLGPDLGIKQLLSLTIFQIVFKVLSP